MDSTNLILKHIKNNFLNIIVKPNSNKTEVLNFDQNKQALRIAVAAPPDKDKANKELIKFLQKQTKKAISITKGLKSRNKRVKFI